MLLAFLLALSLEIILIFSGLFLILYIIKCLGLYRIAKREGYSNAWMAWLPLVNIYLLGRIAYGNIVSGLGLLGLFVFSGSTETEKIKASGSDLIGFIYLIALCVALFRIYKKYSNKAVLMLVFTILSGTTLYPIFLFAIRNNKEIK